MRISGHLPSVSVTQLVVVWYRRTNCADVLCNSVVSSVMMIEKQLASLSKDDHQQVYSVGDAFAMFALSYERLSRPVVFGIWFRFSFGSLYSE